MSNASVDGETLFSFIADKDNLIPIIILARCITHRNLNSVVSNILFI